jgi:hypothetical protein
LLYKPKLNWIKHNAKKIAMLLFLFFRISAWSAPLLPEKAQFSNTSAVPHPIVGEKTTPIVRNNAI